MLFRNDRFRMQIRVFHKGKLAPKIFGCFIDGDAIIMENVLLEKSYLVAVRNGARVLDNFNIFISIIFLRRRMLAFRARGGTELAVILSSVSLA